MVNIKKGCCRPGMSIANVRLQSMTPAIDRRRNRACGSQEEPQEQGTDKPATPTTAAIASVIRHDKARPTITMDGRLSAGRVISSAPAVPARVNRRRASG
jgi:hypothetical protein